MVLRRMNVWNYCKFFLKIEDEYLPGNNLSYFFVLKIQNKKENFKFK